MLSIPRFARMFLLALLLVIVPGAFLFHPSARETAVTRWKLTAGGLDTAPWGDKQEHHANDGHGDEDEPHRDWKAEYAADEEDPDLVKDSVPKAAEGDGDGGVRSGGKPPGELQEGDKNEGSGGTPPGDLDKGDKQVASGGENKQVASGGDKDKADWMGSVADVVSGSVIMSKMGNATAKAELGRGTWRLLHLMTLRYPKTPTEDDKQALKSFFYLFSRLYPCGECAEHFQKMLKQFPPQVGSRETASHWLCSLHNIVNERLHKPEFDCLTLDDVYDCGCTDNATTTAGGVAGQETATAAIA